MIIYNLTGKKKREKGEKKKEEGEEKEEFLISIMTGSWR